MVFRSESSQTARDDRSPASCSVEDRGTFVEFVENGATRHGDRTAVITLSESDSVVLSEPDERSITYRELERRTGDLAAWLSGICAVGDRVLLVHPPGEEFILAFLACLRAGVVAVPVPAPEFSRSDTSRLPSILSDCGATVLLTVSGHAGPLARLLEEEGVPGTSVVATDLLDLPDGRDWDPPRPRADDLAFLQYTSGSTSEPKGVMVSHGNLTHNQRQIQRSMRTDENLVTVAWLPHYHDMGLVGAILHPLFVGGTTCLMSPHTFLRRPWSWLWAVDRYRATSTVAPNFAYELLLRRSGPDRVSSFDLSCLEVALNGAEPVDPLVVAGFREKFAPLGLGRSVMCPCYGLAEATLFVTGRQAGTGAVVTRFHRSSLEGNRLVTEQDGAEGADMVGCGRAIDLDVRIVDPGTSRVLPEGHVGEIWLRGGNVAQGYWGGDPARDEPFRARTADGDGPFLRTGDLGGFHDGDLYVTGRIKDMMIVNGRNIHPQDIEHLAVRSHPSVSDCRGAAFSPAGGSSRVVLVQETRTPSRDRAVLEETVNRIRGRVWSGMGLQLSDVVLVARGTVPRTTSGKVRRNAVAVRYRSGELGTL